MGEARDGHRRALRRRRTRCPRAGSTRPSPRAPRRPTSRSGRPASGATPTRSPAILKPDELRLYRLIWQRALASQMAAKELETTTVELADGRYELRASRDADPVRRLRPGLHRGPRRRGGRGRGGGRHAAAAGRGRSRRRSTTSTPTQHFTEPPPRFTEATLIKALEEHGIGRPSTYAATISTIVDRGYVRVEERRLHPEPVGRDRDRPARRALRRLRRRRVHGPDGGGARRGRPRRARVGARSCARSTGRCATASTRSAASSSASDFTTEATDEVCSEGHPMVIRLGRNGRFLACSLYPEHKETRPLPGRRAAAPGGAPARSAPKCGEGDARRQARPVRAVRRLLALPGLQLHQEGRPAAAGPAAVRGRPARRTTTATSSRVAPGGPGTSSGGARTTRAATSRRTTSRSAACTTPTTARWPARTRRRCCLVCGSTSERRRPTRSCPGERYAGGPPNPEALAPAGARARRRRVAGGTGRTRRRPARGGARPVGRATDDQADPTRSSRPPTRERGVGRDPATDPALARFLRSLAARDASPHTQRAYAHRRRRLPRLAGRRAGRTGATRRGPTCAPTSACSARAAPARRSRSGSPRSARSIAGRRATTSRPGDPWGAIATPRLPAPPAAGPRGRAGRAAPRGRRRRPRRAAPATTPRGRPSGSRSPCATGRSSRPRTPRACGSASWPPPTSARSTCGAARSGSSARAARSGSGCSGGRPAPRSPPTSRTAGRSCSSAAPAPTARRRSRSS